MVAVRLHGPRDLRVDQIPEPGRPGHGEVRLRVTADSARPGARVVLVGILEDDRLTLDHATARRKGLTLVLCRRMKHTYPEACELVSSHSIDVRSIVSHRFPLEQTPEAFAINDRYERDVVKIVLENR